MVAQDGSAPHIDRRTLSHSYWIGAPVDFDRLGAGSRLVLPDVFSLLHVAVLIEARGVQRQAKCWVFA